MAAHTGAKYRPAFTEMSQERGKLERKGYTEKLSPKAGF